MQKKKIPEDLIQPIYLSLDVIKKRIYFFEFLGFAFTMLCLLIIEIFDLQHAFLGAPPQPWVWQESFFQMLVVIILAVIVIIITRNLFKRLQYLRGFLPVCANCKKIRLENEWIPIEKYITEHSEAVLSHGMCPECVEKFYGDLKKIKIKSGK